MSSITDCEILEFNYFKKWLAIGKGKEIHMFSINDDNESVFDSNINCDFHVLKVNWSDNQCVDLLAVLTDDMSVTLYLRSYSKNLGEYSWEEIHKFPAFANKSIIADIKFAPSKHGMLFAILHENGQLFVYQSLSTLFLRKDACWTSVYETSVDRFCVCIGWSSMKLDENNDLIFLAVVAYGKQGDSTDLILSDSSECENDPNPQLERELIFYQMNPIAKLWSRSFGWPLPQNDQIVNNLLFIERSEDCDCILLTSNGFQILNLSYDDVNKFSVIEGNNVTTQTSGIESAFWNYISETLECSCDDGTIHHFTKNVFDYWQETLTHKKLTLSTVLECLATKMEH